MTRIRLNISAALARWRAREPVSPRRFRMMDLQALHEMTLGPGWFDSSWDLDHGLEVELALPGDPSFQAWLEAQARVLEPAVANAAQPLPAEQMLEFEPVDWKAWAPPDGVVDPLPRCLPAGLEMPEFALELALREPEPELELALV